MRGIIITILFSVLLFMSCKKEKIQSGIDLANFDKSYSPQQDFYRYVNGTWLKKTKIPADKSNYGSFTALYDEAQQRLRKIIENAANKDSPSGSDEQKIGDFYKSFMDTARIESLGLKSLKPSIDRVNAVNKKDDFPELIAWLQSIGVQTPFSFYVAQDGKHSDRYICYISQSGLGMPDRDYYLNDSGKFKKFRSQYKKFIIKVLALSGEKNAAKKADRIIAVSSALANTVINLLGISRTKIAIIPNGVDTNEFCPQIRKNNNTFNVLCVSRLIERKGIHFLLDAWKKFIEKNQNSKLFIVGEGNMENELRTQAEKLKINSSVEFTGRLEHEKTVEMYKNADIFVLPSMNEGMSNTILEAMACGLPIVSTGVGGSDELFSDNAIIVPEQNSKTITKALFKLAEDDKLREKMGAVSRANAEKMSWKSVAISYYECYKKM